MGGRQAVALYALGLFEAPMRDSGWSVQRVRGIHFPILGDVLLVIGGSLPPSQKSWQWVHWFQFFGKSTCDPQENFSLNNRIDHHCLWETQGGCLLEQLFWSWFVIRAGIRSDSREFVELRIFRIF